MTLTKQTLLESRDNEQKWTEGKLRLNHGTDMTERGRDGRRQVESSMKGRQNISSYKLRESRPGLNAVPSWSFTLSEGLYSLKYYLVIKNLTKITSAGLMW